jgi:two-component system KDP operon response regulator KdpE
MSKPEPSTSPLRVLIVDDEKEIRKFLKTSLAAEGFDVSEAASGREAIALAASGRPDVILLDLGLPDKDGLEITRSLRKKTRTPIIIISVREDESDKVAALDNGADDYLTKPFDIGELLARIRAVLRRLIPPSGISTILEHGPLSVDLTKRLVTVQGRPVRLSPTEYDMLKLFLAHAGLILTHRQILREIWNRKMDLEGADHLLRVTISNLRDKIEPDPNRPQLIITEPGIGYRLQSLS